MATPVTMPQLGETVVEGTITRWLKNEGDTIERDEPLFEIATDKVATEVPSPLAGKLVEIKVQEGETVGVGTELAMIDTGGDGQAAGKAQAEAPKAESEPEEAEQAEEAADEEERETEKPAEERPVPDQAPRKETGDRQDTGDGRARAPAAVAVQAPAEGGPRSQILSPLVRRLAQEHQIDLSQVHGSGTGGRITKKDVQSFLESGVAAARPAAEVAPAPPTAAAAAPAKEREEAIPLSRMRQAIAPNMAASIQTTARASNLVEANM